MSWRKHLRGNKHKGDEKMKQRKICKHETCKNDAPKDGDYCAKHKPKAKGHKHVSKVGCHTGNVLVFTTPEGIQVFGGGSSRQGGWWVMDPLPDLAIGPSEIVSRHTSSKNLFPSGWKASAFGHTGSDGPAIMSIDWPDYSIPTGLGREFWLALVEDIYTKGVKTISCQCMGGHGRTGVQLAILAHYLLPEDQHTWSDAGELIDWVREHMCVHEVEAQSQQRYIAEVCDLPVGDMRVESSRWGGGGWSSHYASFNTWTKKSQWSYADDDDDDDDDDDFKGWEWDGYQWHKPGKLKLDYDDSPYRIYECLNCDATELVTDAEIEEDKDENGEIPCLSCHVSTMVDVTDVDTGVKDRPDIKEQDETTEDE